MIKTLQIRNFQSHKETDVVFDKGVNVIVGSSDTGKTAIIRALRWAMWNKPSGDSFRSHWGGDTLVTVEFDNGVVSRKKTNTSNEYEVNGTKLTGFGTDVPETVQQVLNISDINLQQQLDRPFLLTETPGNVAKHFNKIAKINKINESLSLLKTKMNTINADIRAIQNNITEYEKQYNTYPDLDVIEVELENVEQNEITRARLGHRIADISVNISAIARMNDRILHSQTEIAYEPHVNDLVQKIEVKKTTHQKIEALTKDIDGVVMCDKKIAAYQRTVSYEKKVHALTTKINAKNKKQAVLTAFIEILRNISAIEKQTLKTLKNKAQYEKQFNEAIGEVCPLCGNEIHK